MLRAGKKGVPDLCWLLLEQAARAPSTSSSSPSRPCLDTPTGPLLSSFSTLHVKLLQDSPAESIAFSVRGTRVTVWLTFAGDPDHTFVDFNVKYIRCITSDNVSCHEASLRRGRQTDMQQPKDYIIIAASKPYTHTITTHLKHNTHRIFPTRN